MLNFSDMFVKGGFVFILIIISSLIAMTIAIERWVFFHNAGKSENKCMPEIKQALENSKDGTVEVIVTAEALRLEQYLYILATIATIAPLLGLLGTVFGMIKTFHAASVTGVSNPGMIAEGISEALYNTAAGLCVTVFCITCHNYFRNRAEQLLQILEAKVSELKDALARRC